jgi:catechol-2,3-dioxygenase
VYIHELQLATQDIDQQFDFYTRVLDLRVQSFNMDHFTLNVGASILSFSVDNGQNPLNYHFAFNILGQSFEMAKRWLKERVALISDPQGTDEFFFEAWNAHAVYFNDPAGNICELIARHTLPSGAVESFSGRNFMSISEIGLAVEDVPDFVQKAQTTLGSPIYRGETNDQFTPVGDENGLLIVVKRGRAWYPEGKVQAVEAPLKVIVSERGEDRYRIEIPPGQLTHVKWDR